jgi:hypothetical protein
MGLISKAFTPQSSHAAKRDGLWPDLMERLGECVLPTDVGAFEQHLDAIALQVPAAWHEPLAELIEKRREEIAEDDVSTLMRRNFDF